jgi:ferredoxin-thioredoxin reductase catalytic subunit
MTAPHPKPEMVDRARRFAEAYTATGAYELNLDPALVETTIQGLAKNLQRHGKMYCPCHVLPEAEEERASLVCPCAPHHQDIRRDGQCHCGIFVAPGTGVKPALPVLAAEAGPPAAVALRSRRVEVAGEDEARAQVERQRWGDGLPAVPPTPARVERMLGATALPPDHEVARVPPNYAPATVEKIAINAVLAGCEPAHLPVVLAGVRAMCHEAFNLHGLAATTHWACPLFIVNGPAARELGFNGGLGAFGNGTASNAVVGRALRLVMMNVGGARPGGIARTTQGHPGRYTYCIAENEAESPWEPLHVERGLPAGASAVTAVAAEAPHGLADQGSRTAEELALSLGWSMAGIWNHQLFPVMAQTLLAVSPEHARVFARDGWRKDDLRRFLFERIRKPLRTWQGADGNRREVSRTVLDLLARGADPETLVPKFPSAESILIAVVGGTGGLFSSVLPGWIQTSTAVTVPIEGVAGKGGPARATPPSLDIPARAD